MSNIIFDLLKVLSKDDKLVLAAQTSAGIKALAKGFAAFCKRGGTLEKGANLTAIVFGGAADLSRVELVGGTANEKSLGRFLTVLKGAGESGSVLLGSDNSLGRLANCTAAVGSLANDSYITVQVEKLTKSVGLLSENRPVALEPTSTGFLAARTAATVAKVVAELSEDQSPTQKVLNVASAAGDAGARAIIGKTLAESDSDYKLVLGANVAETAGTILDLFASEHGEVKMVAGLVVAVSGGFTHIKGTHRLGTLAESARSQRTSGRIPVRKQDILPPAGASE